MQGSSSMYSKYNVVVASLNITLCARRKSLSPSAVWEIWFSFSCQELDEKINITLQLGHTVLLRHYIAPLTRFSQTSVTVRSTEFEAKRKKSAQIWNTANELSSVCTLVASQSK